MLVPRGTETSELNILEDKHSPKTKIPAKPSEVVRNDKNIKAFIAFVICYVSFVECSWDVCALYIVRRLCYALYSLVRRWSQPNIYIASQQGLSLVKQKLWKKEVGWFKVNLSWVMVCCVPTVPCANYNRIYIFLDIYRIWVQK